MSRIHRALGALRGVPAKTAAALSSASSPNLEVIAAVIAMTEQIGELRLEIVALGKRLTERDDLQTEDIERRLRVFLQLMGAIWWTAVKALLMASGRKVWEWGWAVLLGWAAKMYFWPFLAPYLKTLLPT